MTLDKNQICTTCGRDWRGEDAEDVLPGCRCPHEECPSGDAWEWIVDVLCRDGSDLWLLDLPRGVAE